MLVAVCCEVAVVSSVVFVLVAIVANGIIVVTVVVVVLVFVSVTRVVRHCSFVCIVVSLLTSMLLFL